MQQRPKRHSTQRRLRLWRRQSPASFQRTCPLLSLHNHSTLVLFRSAVCWCSAHGSCANIRRRMPRHLAGCSRRIPRWVDTRSEDPCDGRCRTSGKRRAAAGGLQRMNSARGEARRSRSHSGRVTVRQATVVQPRARGAQCCRCSASRCVCALGRSVHREQDEAPSDPWIAGRVSLRARLASSLSPHRILSSHSAHV